MAGELVATLDTGYQAGLTDVVCNVLTRAGATVTGGSAVACSESGTGTAVYVGNMPGSTAAQSLILRFSSATSGGMIYIDQNYWNGSVWDSLFNRVPAALTADGNIKSDALRLGGTVQTGRDIGVSVLLSSGTGTGQLDFASGIVKSNLTQILGTLLTQTYSLAASFKQWFDVTSPAGTVNLIASNTTQIAGQTANAASPVTFPASVGTSTYAGGAVASVAAGVTLAASQHVIVDSGTVTATISDKTGFSLSSAGVLAIYAQAVSALTSSGSFGKVVLDYLFGAGTAANQTTILAAINSITTNTSRSAPRTPVFMPRPPSGSNAYVLDLYLYTLQGTLEDADSNAVTVHARNSGGTSLDIGLSGTTMTRLAQGCYQVAYTVASTDAAGEVYFDFAWTIGSVSMKDGAATQVQDAENYSLLNTINSKIGTPATTLAGDIEAVPTASQNQSGMATHADVLALPSVSQIQNGLATATAMATLSSALSTGITSILSAIPAASANAAAVWSASTRTLSATGVQAIWDALKTAQTTAGSMGAWLAGLSAGLDAAGVRDAVLNAVRADYNTAGTVGEGINSAGAAANPLAATLAELLAYAPQTFASAVARWLLTPGTGPVVELPDPSPDDNKAVVFFDDYRGDGVPMAQKSATFTLSEWPTTNPAGFVDIEAVKARTNAQGRLLVALARTDLMEQTGRVWLVNCEALGLVDVPLTLDSAGPFDLRDLVP